MLVRPAGQDTCTCTLLLAPPVRADKRDRLQGVTHIDGTARVQTVEAATAPRLAALLEHLRRLTGVPIVLNTSFNDREPIVETPAHALATFQAADLDAACIGDYLIERSAPRETNPARQWNA
ncbi:carbamoyltransferase C-terminal domain-containing protein [Sphaerisporangium viridialbum]|uniref:carbamoyltransferase C-terminal domain-containing protein n=1 Tax=Sphaerisporangium viridialbum TaxID=46189 RepID=UPI003C76A729